MTTCTVNNLEVHYQEQGEPNLPVLVLIHGLGCSLKYWGCVFEAEELTHYRILALDLPGFGMSEKPATYDYHLSSQADITYAFLKQLQIPKVSLIGHSMGGSIAIILAHKHPEIVERLLVIEPNLKASDAHLSRDIIRQAEADFVKNYEDFKRIAIETVQNWFVNSHRADIEEYSGELLKTTPVSIYRSAQSLMTVTADDTLLLQFQQFGMPRYFLIGEETLKIRNIPESLQSGNVQTVIVPGVGHMMMVDNPLLFNRTLASILP